MRKDDSDMAGNLIQIGLFILAVLIGGAGIGVRRSARRRRTVERQAAVRSAALARYTAGMPAGHPEAPVPPGLAELVRYGGFYEHVRAALRAPEGRQP